MWYLVPFISFSIIVLEENIIKNSSGMSQSLLHIISRYRISYIHRSIIQYCPTARLLEATIKKAFFDLILLSRTQLARRCHAALAEECTCLEKVRFTQFLFNLAAQF